MKRSARTIGWILLAIAAVVGLAGLIFVAVFIYEMLTGPSLFT